MSIDKGPAEVPDLDSFHNGRVDQIRRRWLDDTAGAPEPGSTAAMARDDIALVMNLLEIEARERICLLREIGELRDGHRKAQANEKAHQERIAGILFLLETGTRLESSWELKRFLSDLRDCAAPPVVTEETRIAMRQSIGEHAERQLDAIERRHLITEKPR